MLQQQPLREPDNCQHGEQRTGLNARTNPGNHRVRSFNPSLSQPVLGDLSDARPATSECLNRELQ